jgi:hypothetical protein
MEFSLVLVYSSSRPDALLSKVHRVVPCSVNIALHLSLHAMHCADVLKAILKWAEDLDLKS